MAKKKSKVNERDEFILNNVSLPEWERKYTPLDKIRKGDYDIFHFEGLTADQAEHCVAKGWLDLNEKQNDAPNVAEILKFLKANPSFGAIGYVIPPKREDTRISFEGVISITLPSNNESHNFARMFRHADEFEISENLHRAWFD